MLGRYRPLVRRILAGWVAALVLAPSAPDAHEIPSDVTVRAFVKPEGPRLRLLVRVPLAALVDVNYPTSGPGYLDLERIGPVLREAASLWISDFAQLQEADRRLGEPEIAAVRVSLPSDPSFISYQRALAHVTTGEPLANDTELYWEQGMLDALFEYPIDSDRSDFSFRSGLPALGIGVTTVLRFLPPEGPERAFQFHGDAGLVRLDPRWHQAALRFTGSGFVHILDGIDHLLFLFCLVIPFRRLRPLVLVVTSFTVAHSITLIASAFDLAPNALWFPPLVETLIALSIVYMAVENVVAPQLERRWLITFGFGLVHGFGFSFALRETLQFAGSHLLTSLLAFNVGVEFGQLFVLVLLVPALSLLFRFGVAERIGTILLSALVAHTGWHWLVERAAVLPQYQFAWPALDLALLATAVRWMILIVIVAGFGWLLGLLRQPAGPNAEHQSRFRDPAI